MIDWYEVERSEELRKVDEVLLALLEDRRILYKAAGVPFPKRWEKERQEILKRMEDRKL